MTEPTAPQAQPTAAMIVIGDEVLSGRTRDINIWDGAFHEAYPFDFHRENQANNNTGVIHYKVARHSGAWPFPSGIFARVHFEAKVSTPLTVIRLVRSPQRNRPQTFVRGMGLGAVILDVTGLPDPSTVREVARIREPEMPGGFHNIFIYKHSNDRVYLFTTARAPGALVYDLAHGVRQK